MGFQRPSQFTSIEEILEYAMNEEHEAQEYYLKAAKRVADPKMKEFLKELAEMEGDHYTILKRKLDECRTDQFCAHGILSSFNEDV